MTRPPDKNPDNTVSRGRVLTSLAGGDKLRAHAGGGASVTADRGSVVVWTWAGSAEKQEPSSGCRDCSPQGTGMEDTALTGSASGRKRSCRAIDGQRCGSQNKFVV